MKKLNPFTRWVFVLLMFALTSCGGSSDESAIQTIVAGTLQSLAVTEPALTTATKMPPTAESLASPLPTSAQSAVTAPNVEFEGISFNLDYQLANAWAYEVTSPPDPASDNPFQTPSYYQLDFQGFVVPAGSDSRGWRVPRLYIIPVANMQSFPGGGYGTSALSQLQQILASKPAVISEKMPVVPHWINFNNGEVFHSNMQYLNFQNGSGVRFLAEYAQSAFPVGKVISYIFQGLTNDGNYYVSLTLPISQTALDQYNDPYNTSISDEASYQVFAANYASYLQGAVAILETTPASNFTPDLGRLDALIQSLSVKP